MVISPLTNPSLILEDERCLLRHIVNDDFDDFSIIAFDKSIWKFSTNEIMTPPRLREWLERGISDQKSGIRFPFTIVDKQKNSVAGSSAFGNISIRDARIEIGWTWLGKEFQGTGLNRHAKLLLLTFAFEKLGCLRVELKTDVLNQQSRKAMLKIGAVEEGILRSHTLMHDGRRRNTIYYSILANEWPGVKKQLREM